MKKKLKQLIIASILLCCIGICTYASDENSNDKDQKEATKNKQTQAEKTNEKLESEEEIPEYENKKNTLLYGLGSDILDLIKELQAEEDDRFDADLKQVFSETKIPDIRIRLFEYFAKTENNCLKKESLSILENRDNYPKDTVSSAILYSRDLKIEEANKFLRNILKEEDTDYMVLAISALGKIGTEEDAVFLTEIFDYEYFEDDKQSLILKQNIASALEDLHSKETWDFLVDNASDLDQNAIIRGRFATALGKIGDEKAIPILCELFEDKDPILRVAAIKGLAEFKTAEADTVLLQGFKDSYYKVRLQAIKSAQEEKNKKAIPYILYRAKKDPEVSIKYKAIEALSEFNDDKSTKWLVDSFEGKKTAQNLKLKIAYFMLKNNFDQIYSSVERELLQLLDNTSNSQNKKMAMELGKIVSKIENQKTAPIAEKFLDNKDAMVKSIGLDMFKKNKYAVLIDKVSAIAEDKKSGTLGRRAKSLLENPKRSDDTNSKEITTKKLD